MKVILHFKWDYVTTASSYIAGYLSKAIWNLSNLCKAIFCPAYIYGKILCMSLLKILKNRQLVTFCVKSRLLAVINLII